MKKTRFVIGLIALSSLIIMGCADPNGGGRPHGGNGFVPGEGGGVGPDTGNGGSGTEIPENLSPLAKKLVGTWSHIQDAEGTQPGNFHTFVINNDGKTGTYTIQSNSGQVEKEEFNIKLYYDNEDRGEVNVYKIVNDQEVRVEDFVNITENSFDTKQNEISSKTYYKNNYMVNKIENAFGTTDTWTATDNGTTYEIRITSPSHGLDGNIDMRKGDKRENYSRYVIATDVIRINFGQEVERIKFVKVDGKTIITKIGDNEVVFSKKAI